MPNAAELLRQGKKEELWQMCCGFIDLSMEQFMAIQQRLLLEQLELLKKCELGRHVMCGAEPSSMKEFREQIPLTTYADYAPFLQEKREDVLPEKPIFWMRCIGKAGEYRFKWVPISEKVYQEAGKLIFAAAVFSSCKKRGDIAIKEQDKFLHALAPPPFATGMMAHMINDVFSFALIPPLELAEKMAFEEKIKRGFEIAQSEGLDFFGGLTSVLVKVGEQFSQDINNNNNIISLLSKPKALPRLGKGWLKSKLAGRPMLPKDVWSLKGIVGGGTDTSVYREKVKDLWGRYPLDIYGCTENIVLAMQTWDYEGMTFSPYLSLLEFIPVDEYQIWKAVPTFQPKTFLLDEVKPGQSYVLAITNFHGMPFVRYVIGDMIKIASLRNEKLDIDIPQVLFDRRVDGLIDLAGFARLTERTIEQAIESAHLVTEYWIARKEVSGGKPVLHLYISLGNGRDGMSEEKVAKAIHKQLCNMDKDYGDLETMLDLKPLKVTLIPSSTFREYISKQLANNGDLTYSRTLRTDSSDRDIDIMMNSVQHS